MKITKEPYSKELAAELGELFESHCEEISMFGEKVDPDFTVYETIDAQGLLHIFIARETGKAIGYVVYFIHNHHHYKGMRVAEQDVLYLHPDHRKGTDGIRLIKESEKQLDVDCILQHTKSARDLGGLLKFIGYEKMDTVYMRKL